MSARTVIFGFLTMAILSMAVMLYWIWSHQPVRDDGRLSITIQGQEVPVSNYLGVTHPTLPLRLRACFTVADPAAVIASAPAMPNAEPFGAIGMIECYAPEMIDAGLKSGKATAILAAEEGRRISTVCPDGKEPPLPFQRIIAVFEDGRAFMWRRLHPREEGCR